MRGLIKGYPVGANISVLNTIYLRPQKLNDGSYSDDILYIIYKDLDTGEKKYEMIRNPKYRYYIAKDNVPINHNLMFIEKDLVRPVECRYKDLKYSIAKETGNLDWYKQNIQSGNYRANDKLLTLPRVFAADMHIEDFYRCEFNRLYQNKPFTPTKAYFDIEVDAINAKADFPEMGECPINAINLIDEQHKKSYALLLDDYDNSNPQIAEFKNDPNIMNELKTLIRNHVGGWKNEARLGLDGYEYKIIFFDDELNLITTFFNLINAINPDFATAWNMAFDIPYLIARLWALGANPNEVISHPDFEVKYANYFVDNRADKFAERGDFAIITCYTVYICGLITFTSRRKGQRAIPEFNLNFIGEFIARVKKLDYSNITTNVLKLVRLCYKIFVFYNIVDTIVQKCIESKVGDLDFVLTKAITTNTRYSKVHRQSVYLVNRGHRDFWDMGYVLGDNINKNNQKVGFVGAYTSDPKKLSDKPKVRINGYPVMIVRNLNDFDCFKVVA